MLLRIFYAITVLTITSGCQVNLNQAQVLQVQPAQATPTRPDAQALCERLPEIKEIPFKDEPVEDEAYNSFIAASNEAVPCLIDRLDDSTKMKDPRSAPQYRDFKVGDLAYIMLVRITKVPFESMLPDDVRERMKEEGVYAYFDYVQNPDNRRVIQSRWRAWLTTGVNIPPPQSTRP